MKISKLASWGLVCKELPLRSQKTKYCHCLKHCISCGQERSVISVVHMFWGFWKECWSLGLSQYLLCWVFVTSDSVEGRHVELCLRTTYQRVKPRLHSILFRGVQGKHLGAGFLMSKTASVIPEKHFEGIQASDGMQSIQSCYLSTTSHHQCGRTCNLMEGCSQPN